VELCQLINIERVYSVLQAVRKICFQKVGALTVESGSSIILTIGKKGISREENPNYTDGWTSSGTRKFELITAVDWVPIIAEYLHGPYGLTGERHFLAIGIWDFLEQISASKTTIITFLLTIC
jgi:hypothetical protein